MRVMTQAAIQLCHMTENTLARVEDLTMTTDRRPHDHNMTMDMTMERSTNDQKGTSERTD